MVLVTGGIASGKRTYLRRLGFTDADLSRDAADGRSALIDAQELVRDPRVDVGDLADAIASRKQAVAVVEVGSGIVPLERAERDWRDRAGALARELAQRSDVVVRMVCGIPIALKGALPGEDSRGVRDCGVGLRSGEERGGSTSSKEGDETCRS